MLEFIGQLREAYRVTGRAYSRDNIEIGLREYISLK